MCAPPASIKSAADAGVASVTDFFEHDLRGRLVGVVLKGQLDSIALEDLLDLIDVLWEDTTAKPEQGAADIPSQPTALIEGLQSRDSTGYTDQLQLMLTAGCEEAIEVLRSYPLWVAVSGPQIDALVSHRSDLFKQLVDTLGVGSGWGEVFSNTGVTLAKAGDVAIAFFSTEKVCRHKAESSRYIIRIHKNILTEKEITFFLRGEILLCLFDMTAID